MFKHLESKYIAIIPAIFVGRLYNCARGNGGNTK